RLAGVDPLERRFAAEIFADRDVFHFRRDDAALGVAVLRHRLARFAAQHLAAGAVEHRYGALFAAAEAVILRLDVAPDDLLDIAARQDPRPAQFRQADPDVGRHRRVGVGARRVVD